MIRPLLRPLGWVPVLVVGLVSAVAAEVGVALLLYAGPGFVRSLTTILAVGALALAAGFRFPFPAAEPVDGLRRRWILALVSLLVSTVFGTVWTLVPSLGAGSLAQGIGLGLLTALPLYVCGALFSGLAREAQDAGVAGRFGVASGGAFGAAIGFALTGVLLPNAPTPSSLLVGCLVLLSLGGMSYGVVRRARPSVRTIAEGCAGPPPVRVEERFAGGHGPTHWVLLEGSTVRRTRSRPVDADAQSGPPQDPPEWDVEWARTLDLPDDDPFRVLCVGGGASLLPRTLSHRRPLVEVTVLERAHCVVDLGRAHFETGLGDTPAGTGRVHVLVGNVENGIRAIPGPFDLIVIDGRAFDAWGGLDGLSHDARRVLTEHLAPGGAMVWGPRAVHHPRDVPAALWLATREDLSALHAEILVLRRAPAADSVTASVEGGLPTS